MAETTKAAVKSARAGAVADEAATRALEKWFKDSQRAGDAVGEITQQDNESLADMRLRIGREYDRAYYDLKPGEAIPADPYGNIDEERRKILEQMVGQMTQGNIYVDQYGNPVGVGNFASGRPMAVKMMGDYHALNPDDTLQKYGDRAKPVVDAFLRVDNLPAGQEKPTTLRERAKIVFGSVYGKGFGEDGASNSGPVPHLLDSDGSMWCGGAEWAFDAAVSGGQIYNHKSFLSAASFGAVGGKYGALRSASSIKANDPATWPKTGDTILVRGAGPSGFHPLTVGEVDPVTGMMTVGAGNHGHQMAEFKMHVTSGRIIKYVSKDGILLEKAKRGEAVLDEKGMPILSMDQEVTITRSPHLWLEQVFADKAQVEAGRALGKAMAEAKASGVTIDHSQFVTAVTDLGGTAKAMQVLDANKDGQLTKDDITAARNAGIQLTGDVDSMPEYIAAMAQVTKAGAGVQK